MIYIDSDGIGADWIGYVTKNHFGGISQAELNKLPDLTERLTEMYKVDRHLFYNLKPIPGFRELFRAILRAGDYRILTVGAKDMHTDEGMVEEDKRNWWAKYFRVPAGKVLVVRSRADKPKFVRSHKDILIDDHLGTIEDFVDAGGCGIYIPTGFEHTPERLILFKSALIKLLTLEPNNHGYISLT